MAVTSGTTALLSEHTTLRTNVNLIFADNYPSITYGGANQVFGWGGAAASAAAGVIDASEMNPLVDRLNVGKDVLSTVSGTLSQIAAATKIDASDYNTIDTRANLITAQRNNIDAAETSVSGTGSSVRSTTWSAAIYYQWRYTWTNFAAARYFWNSGGQMRALGTITGYSTGTGWDGQGINQILTNCGTLIFDRTSTSQTGSGGSLATTTGFYDLPGTGWVLICTQTGTGVYTDAKLEVWVRRSATGNWAEFYYKLTPGAGRSVNGTTTGYSQFRKLDNQSSGAASLSITAPTYSLQHAF